MMPRAFAQSFRLMWIDARLFFMGNIRRADIQNAFAMSTPQASADITAFRRLSPGRITYNASVKAYEVSGPSRYEPTTLDLIWRAQKAVALMQFSEPA